MKEKIGRPLIYGEPTVKKTLFIPKSKLKIILGLLENWKIKTDE